MSELLIRAGTNDHRVIEDLLAPGPGPRPISRLVVNAQDVYRRPELAGAAAKAGIPLIVDPTTLLAQGELRADDPWTGLPFGRAEAISPETLPNEFALERLVADVVAFQADAGATTIIPPYFYADHPDSPAFAASIKAIALTARRMRTDGVVLPIMPIACFKLPSFSKGPGWRASLDRFTAAATDVGPQAVGLFASPVGDGNENYAKLVELLSVAQYMRAAGVPTIAWRQGVYGPALVASGLDGYECGMGIGESSAARTYITSRKPRSVSGQPSRGFSAQGVFIPALSRSLPPKVAAALFDDRRLRGALVCASPRCCPQGFSDMTKSKGRPHAVRARSRDLRELDEIPNDDWRMLQVEKHAAAATNIAGRVNEVLASAGLSNRVKTRGYESLSAALEFFRKAGSTGSRHSA